jgi:hypothetical protein
VSTKAWDPVFQAAGVTHIEEGVSDSPLRAVFVELKRPGPDGTADGGSGPPPFAGEAATKKLDNERVTLWEFTASPPATAHRHTRDAVAVAIDGRNPRAVWVPRGTVHADEGVGAAPRIYILEIK